MRRLNRRRFERILVFAASIMLLFYLFQDELKLTIGVHNYKEALDHEGTAESIDDIEISPERSHVYPSPSDKIFTESESSEKATDHEDALEMTANTMAAQQTIGNSNNNYERENATFIVLARNSDLVFIQKSIMEVEKRFNQRYHYDWVFLNNKPFTEEFKGNTTKLVSGNAYYGDIPLEHWSFPDWLDHEEFEITRIEMKNIIYGDSISYRHMCRYESGFFWRHPLINNYEYYWRVEPNIELHCDINYDVFKFMRENKKEYGFAITLPEYEETIPTLWRTTQEFLREHPEHVAKNNLMKLISDNEGKTYNLCHFWSNFEIGKLSFWRSQAYQDYFDYLDHKGGFFYERWGDAPIHTMAVSLFLDRNKVHFFNDIGYFHAPFQSCPIDRKLWEEKNCDCNPDRDITFSFLSCTEAYHNIMGLKKPLGWEDHSYKAPGAILQDPGV